MYEPVVPYRDVDHDASPPADGIPASARSSMESTSTTSLILERIHHEDPDDSDGDDMAYGAAGRASRERDVEKDIETGRATYPKPMEQKVRRAMYIIGVLMVGGWFLALAIYVSREYYRTSDVPHDPAATSTPKAGKTITLDQVIGGNWRSRTHGIQWIDGPEGQDGMLLTETPFGEGNYLEVTDVRNSSNTIVLIKDRTLQGDGKPVIAIKAWPSPDLKKVLVASDVETVCPDSPLSS